MKAIIIAALTGSIFVWFGGYGAKSLDAAVTCEAYGYHTSRVRWNLTQECGAWGNDGQIWAPIEEVSDPVGEVDG